jgi:hypothetical protein
MIKSITLKKSITLISLFAVLMVAFSGCVDENAPTTNGTDAETPGTSVISDENVSEISTLKAVPSGFEYIYTLPLSTENIKNDYNAENVSGILEGSEAGYKDSNETDYYIDVIKFEDKEAANNFIEAYKSSFKPLNNSSNFSRFTDESFNGHSALKITDFVTSNGETIPRYSYIWSNENYVIVVFGNTAEESSIRKLAEATGY